MPNWRGSQKPQAFWGNATAFVSGDGVEDLSLDHTASTQGASGINFTFARSSWVKNVRSINANRDHVLFYQSMNLTVRDSYFYGTQHAASMSYGIEGYMTSDDLVENNITQRIVGPLITNLGSGIVYGHNYSINDYYGDNHWMQASSYMHGLTDNVLHEGNEGVGFDGDIVHSSHNLVTAFRNRWVGAEPGKSAQTIPIIFTSNNRYMNVVGNVLGLFGYHDTYEWYTPESASDPRFQTSIYRFGFGYTNVPDDPLVRSSLMRWGNYDTVSGASCNSLANCPAGTVFSNAEVPSTLSLYGNPVPTTHALPASFYLTSKPPFWGSMPWPAVGPDVTGGDIPNVGGHAYMNPAMACYTNVMRGPADGSGGPLTFNGKSCY
jgi:hypothetical protein